MRKMKLTKSDIKTIIKAAEGYPKDRIFSYFSDQGYILGDEEEVAKRLNRDPASRAIG